MKKILGVMILLAFCLSAYSAQTKRYLQGTAAANSCVANVWAVQLGKCMGDTTTAIGDSINAAGVNTYGPFRLSISDDRGMATGFQVYGNTGCLSDGDSVSISYQILPGNKITDTLVTSGWTTTDTIITGKKGTYTSIASRAGQSIVFRITAHDGTGVLIQKPIRVLFYETYTSSRSTR